MGFGSINSSGTVKQGVQSFEGARRQSFYDSLYATPTNPSGTPLRRAMDDVGKYFSGSDAHNPWAEQPQSNAIGTELSCRRSVHILSTDGFWNGSGASGAAASDNDAFSGNTPQRKDGALFKYENSSTSTDPLAKRFTVDPYGDGIANTLADVAAYYWKTDLRTNLANDVPSTTRDPAFWQHLTTYTVGLGITGSGQVRRQSDRSTTVPMSEPASSPYYAWRGQAWLATEDLRNALLARRESMLWTTPTENAIETGDDLIHAAMNGHGRYFGAANPRALKDGLSAALAEAADKSSGLAGISTQSAQVLAGSQVYQAIYNPNQWSGRLYAYPQSAGGAVAAIPENALWEASNKMPAPIDRKIFTWRPDTRAGTLFEWPLLGVQPLASTQMSALGNPDVLNYLRGDGSKELSRGGIFRDRVRSAIGGVPGGVLGDIVDSSPTKGPAEGFDYDQLPAGSPGQASYAAYLAKPERATLGNTLFVGANDGMLHAFNSVDGVERFAYVPNAVFTVPRSPALPELKLKMLSDPGYAHRYTVDGTPQISDAFIGAPGAERWRSVLAASTGAGARAVFALDVSNPVPAATNGFDASKALWEFSDADDADMGYVLAYPHVARMRNGQWVAIFGNGYDSASGQAKLILRDLRTGARVWEAKVGAAGGNGLSQPNFIVNASREVIAIYAGDLRGSLWKFDVSATDPTKWKVAYGGPPNYTPLFKGSTDQPIAVMPTIAPHPNGGVMVSFGTGTLFNTNDAAADDSSNLNLKTQAIYGIWDKPEQTTGFSGNATLQPRAMKTDLAVAADASLSGTTSGEIDWVTKRGWYFDLASGGERVIVNPLQIASVLIVTSSTPNLAACSTGGSSRVFVLDPVTGSAPGFGVFDADLRNGITIGDKGWNVRSLNSAMLSEPVLQGKDGSTKDHAKVGVRRGGVDLQPAKSPCDQEMLGGLSNAGVANFDLTICPKDKPRISWRQLK